MSSNLQTIVALTIVALATVLLLRFWFGKKKSTGCGHGNCGAVSPEVKKLQAKLRQ